MAKRRKPKTASSKQRAILRKNWGDNFDLRIFLAGRGCREAGFTAKEINSIEKMIGYRRTMRLFLLVGLGMFVVSPATRKTLAATRAALKRAGHPLDETWANDLANDLAAFRD